MVRPPASKIANLFCGRLFPRLSADKRRSSTTFRDTRLASSNGAGARQLPRSRPPRLGSEGDPRPWSGGHRSPRARACCCRSQLCV